VETAHLKRLHAVASTTRATFAPPSAQVSQIMTESSVERNNKFLHWDALIKVGETELRRPDLQVQHSINIYAVNSFRVNTNQRQSQ
jgi:hypothetical protein